MPRFSTSCYGSLAVAVLVVEAAWLTANALPFSGVDDIEFKQAGLELATSGRFAAPALEGYYPGLDRAFLLIPPLYPLCYAAWVGLAGPSLYAALVFGFALRLAAAGLLFGLIRSWNVGVRPGWAALLALAFGVIPDHLDRPESLTIPLSLGALLLLAGDGAAPPSRRRLAAGVLCGCGTAAQPIVGGLYTIAAFGELVGSARAAPRVVLVTATRFAAVTVGTFVLIWLPLVVAHPGLFVDQFVALFVWNAGSALDGFVDEAGPALARFRWAAPLAALAIAGVAAAALGRRADARRRTRAVTVGVILVAVIAFAPGKNTYFTALLPLLIAAGSGGLSGRSHEEARGSGWRRRLGAAALAAAIAACALPALRLAALPLTWTEADRYDSSGRRLRARVPAGATVLTDAPLWHALATHARIRDGFFVREAGLRDADYVVSVNNGSGEAGLSVIRSDRRARALLESQFRLVDSTLIAEPNRLLGVPISRSRWGYRWELFERKRSGADSD